MGNSYFLSWIRVAHVTLFLRVTLFWKGKWIKKLCISAPCRWTQCHVIPAAQWWSYVSVAYFGINYYFCSMGRRSITNLMTPSTVLFLKLPFCRFPELLYPWVHLWPGVTSMDHPAFTHPEPQCQEDIHFTATIVPWEFFGLFALFI